MIEITKKQAIDNNLKFIARIVGTNLSRTILILERASKENKKIKYYTMEHAIVNEETHNGEFLGMKN